MCHTISTLFLEDGAGPSIQLETTDYDVPPPHIILPHHLHAQPDSDEDSEERRRNVEAFQLKQSMRQMELRLAQLNAQSGEFFIISIHN